MNRSSRIHGYDSLAYKNWDNGSKLGGTDSLPN